MERRFSYYKTRDNTTLRYGAWRGENSENQGTVIYLSGRAEFIEKNAETIDDLIQKGFDVYALDWRGQGLSDRLLPNRHKGYIDDFIKYVNDLHQFMTGIVYPSACRPLIFLSHSMGGHITLRYLHDFETDIERAILVAPMINIDTRPIPTFLVRWVAGIAMRMGLAEHYIPDAGDYDAAATAFRGNRLTSDPNRFTDEHREIAANPDLAIGGVTWCWLAEAFKSIAAIQSPGYAESITTPILMISGGYDRVVSLQAQKEFCLRLQDCTHLILDAARHEILKESDEVRNLFWIIFDRFVSTETTTSINCQQMEDAYGF